MVRWKGYLEKVLASYARHGVKDNLRYLLWIGLYQVAFMKKADYHVVNETVEFIKREKGQAPANFANAVLRRFLREREEQSPTANVEYSYPPWLAKRWKERFGAEDARKLFTVLNENPRFFLRVDLGRMSVQDAISGLALEGVTAREGQFCKSALLVDKLAPVLRSSLFAQGLVTVQDEMSQLAGYAMDAETKGPVLDACSGLGTKADQIRALLPGAVVISMDNEILRLGLSSDKRLSIVGDAGRPPFRKGLFSAILLDAPCSSLGILRKHPEIKWHRRLRDIRSFADYQFTLLKTLWELLAPEGRLVYSVCSFEPEETVEVLERFAREASFVLENPVPFLFNKEYFLSLPHKTGADGFFIAKMKKL